VVVNVLVKRRDLITSCRDERDERKRTSDEASKPPQMTSKPACPPYAGMSMAGTSLLAMWCPVYRRRDSHAGSRMERENLHGDAKGKGTSGSPVRPNVPIRCAGADCFVVVRKWGNAHGAKGAGHRVGDRVNWRQEEPHRLNGRRQPSFGGTSRMNREVHVRICERLRVKFPGPTRRLRNRELRWN
jgi:hypothetical protein